MYRVQQKVTSLVADGRYYLSPIELLIDVPFDAGCFQELEDISNIGHEIDTPVETLTPTWCNTKCLQVDGKKRYACIS